MTRARAVRFLALSLLPRRVRARIRAREMAKHRKTRRLVEWLRSVARTAALEAVAPVVDTVAKAMDTVSAADAARAADRVEVERLVQGLREGR